jgi:hydroxyacylglutathione hydrolase
LEAEMAEVRIERFADEGLGHSSYLVDLDDGTALVIDPARLPDRQRAWAASSGLEIAYTADTHTHADYISGSPELARDGAVFLAPVAGGLRHPHRGLVDGETVPVGHYELRAVATPGHTPDHLAYVLQDRFGPVALFSGGSLMVGTVGRTDLLGDEQAEALAHQMYRSLNERLMTLPPNLVVYPTHGAGSFCAAPGAAAHVTTIGQERATNPLVGIENEDEFICSLLAGLGSFPPYFRELPALNQRGVTQYRGAPSLAPLSCDQVEMQMAQGVTVVDVRPVARFASGHIPGSVSIELRGVFASWLGWLVEREDPVIFVLDDGQDEDDLVRQALTIGHDRLGGRLAGGIDAWVAEGRPLDSIELIEPDAVDRPLIDIRQANEYRLGHVPGALQRELGDLLTSDVPGGPVATMCGKTERAMTAASVLRRRGAPDVVVLHGGLGAWSAIEGNSPEVGP